MVQTDTWTWLLEVSGSHAGVSMENQHMKIRTGLLSRGPRSCPWCCLEVLLSACWPLSTQAPGNLGGNWEMPLTRDHVPPALGNAMLRILREMKRAEYQQCNFSLTNGTSQALPYLITCLSLLCFFLPHPIHKPILYPTLSKPYPDPIHNQS